MNQPKDNHEKVEKYMDMVSQCHILHKYRGYNRNSCNTMLFHINIVQVTFFTYQVSAHTSEEKIFYSYSPIRLQLRKDSSIAFKFALTLENLIESRCGYVSQGSNTSI